MATLQTERVKAAKARAEAKRAKAEESRQVEETKEEQSYNVAPVLQVASAIISSDKTVLLNIPALIVKAKAVIDEARKL